MDVISHSITYHNGNKVKTEEFVPFDVR